MQIRYLTQIDRFDAKWPDGNGGHDFGLIPVWIRRKHWKPYFAEAMNRAQQSPCEWVEVEEAEPNRQLRAM